MKAGRGLGTGVQIIHLAAGITGDTRYKGLTDYLSPQEIQVLLNQVSWILSNHPEIHHMP